METEELRSMTAVLKACRESTDKRCGEEATARTRSMMMMADMARRVTAAERMAKNADRDRDAARKACAAASSRAKVAEQCRDSAEARAVGWKIVAVVAAVVALLVGTAADGSRREAEYWKAKAQTTQAQPEIAYVERDPELGRAVVWYK